MKHKEPIPVTVLTGFFGAGKTTLLNHLLTQKHGYRCAIIINEFGAVSIDNQLVVGADEEILELNNGCLCCRVRGDLIRSLGELFKKQKRFDYVLIETTGLADPGPVAQTFTVPELADKLRLDAIVTVADAKHLEKELGDAPEASAQIAFADVVLLNKTDLVTPSALEHVEARIRRINPLARIHHTLRSQIEPAKIFNLQARGLGPSFTMENVVPVDHAAEAEAHEHEHDHDDDHHDESDAEHGHEEPHHHHHDERVGSICLTDDHPLDLQKTEAWLGELLSTIGPDIYRAKGILNVRGQSKRIVFQGVQMTFEAQPDRLWRAGEPRLNQLVFIGRELDEAQIRAGFANCHADA